MDGWQSPQEPPRPPAGFAPPPYGSPPPPPQQGFYGPPPTPYGYGSHMAGVPVGYTPPSERPTNAVKGLAVAITCVMGFQFIAMALAFGGFAWRLSLLSKLDSDPGSVPFDTVTRSDNLVRTGTVLEALGFIALATLVMIWLWKARTNAGVYAPGLMRLGRGWAVGGWFIPLANWVLPFIVAGDVARGTTTGLPGRRERVGVPAWVWWISWVAANLIGGVAGIEANKGNPDTDSAAYLKGLHDNAQSDLVALPLLTLAGAMLLVFIWQVTRVQKLRNAAYAPPPMPFGYPYGAPVQGPMAGFGQPPMPGPLAVPPPGYGYQGGVLPPAAPMQTMPSMPQMPPVQPMPQMPPMPPGMAGAAPTPGLGATPQYQPVTAPANPPTVVDRLPEMHTAAVPSATVVDAVPGVQDAVPTQSVPPATVVEALPDAVVTQAVPAPTVVEALPDSVATQAVSATEAAAALRDSTTTQAVSAAEVAEVLRTSGTTGAVQDAVPGVQDAVPAEFAVPAKPTEPETPGFTQPL